MVKDIFLSSVASISLSASEKGDFAEAAVTINSLTRETRSKEYENNVHIVPSYFNNYKTNLESTTEMALKYNLNGNYTVPFVNCNPTI